MPAAAYRITITMAIEADFLDFKKLILQFLMKFILDCRRLIKFHYIIHNVLSTRYVGTRDLPGNALVLKQKYNLENRSKRQYWNIFQ